MNTKSIPSLAAALAVLLPGAAFSANATFTAGDLLMGFRATAEPGSTTSYVINLGPVSVLRDATAPVVLNLGDIKADLDATFGNDWRSRTDLFWGVGGSPSNSVDVNGDPAVTLYGSKAEETAGVPVGGYSIAGAATRAGFSTIMRGFQDAFDDYPQTAVGINAVLQDNNGNYDWRAYMSPGGDSDKTAGNKDFAAFSDIEGIPSKTLSLFRLPNQAAGVYEGSFSIDASGVITFTPASAGVTYATWATTNAPGQTESQDYDGDGLPNGVEFFMGTAGNAFTAHPAPVNGVVTWPRATGTVVTSFGVQISTDLGATDPWHTPPSGVVTNPASVVYTLPTGMPKVFARLTVTP